MLGDESLSVAFDRLVGRLTTTQRVAFNKEMDRAITNGRDAARKACRDSGPNRKFAEMSLDTVAQYAFARESGSPGQYIKGKMTPETRALLAVDTMTEPDRRLLEWQFIFAVIFNYHREMTTCR